MIEVRGFHIIFLLAETSVDI